MFDQRQELLVEDNETDENLMRLRITCSDRDPYQGQSLWILM